MVQSIAQLSKVIILDLWMYAYMAANIRGNAGNIVYKLTSADILKTFKKESNEKFLPTLEILIYYLLSTHHQITFGDLGIQENKLLLCAHLKILYITHR